MTYFERIYNRTREAVEEIVPDLPNEWMQRKTYEATIAKAILIIHLELQGFTRRLICHYTGLGKSTVKQHINTYNARLETDRLLRILTAHVGNKLKASGTGE
jgi:hypothetical protein